MLMNFDIGNREVGLGKPCYIIAEISCNHHQKLQNALRLIEEAKAAGADAVKFQTYTPDTMTLDVKNEYFQIKGTLWEGQTLHDLYKKAYTPWEWFPELSDRAKSEGIQFFSSPFDLSAVDLLEKLDVPAYKIASFEINHIPLIQKVASLKKPIIFSTGVADKSDIELALKTISAASNDKVILMKCTSAYPAPLSEMNLKMIPYLSSTFGVPVGLSDHSMDPNMAVAAVSLGAVAIEKHFIYSRKEGGPDAAFSLEPKELKALVKSVRDTEEALGEVTYDIGEKVREHRFLMRSIFVSKDIKKGEKFTPSNISIVRPSNGLAPVNYPKVLGKTATKDLLAGTPLSWELIQ